MFNARQKGDGSNSPMPPSPILYSSKRENFLLSSPLPSQMLTTPNFSIKHLSRGNRSVVIFERFQIVTMKLQMPAPGGDQQRNEAVASRVLSDILQRLAG